LFIIERILRHKNQAEIIFYWLNWIKYERFSKKKKMFWAESLFLNHNNYINFSYVPSYPKYLFFPIYYVAFIDVLIDIEKYWKIIIRVRIFKKYKRKNIFFSLIMHVCMLHVCMYATCMHVEKILMISILNVLFAKFYKNIIDILPNIFSQYFIIQFFRRVVNLRQFEIKTIFKIYFKTKETDA
jgi:hypothetical protein